MFNDWRDFSRRASNSAVAHSSGGAHELHTFRLPSAAGNEDETIVIRLANGDGQKRQAKVLIDRAYSRRGYGADHQLPSAPSCITFMATSGEEVVGTLTLTVDSPSGLAADRTFSDEVEKFRAVPGAKLCELTKFAFETSTPARPRLAALFHIIFIYESLHYGCTDLLIEVNPRHCCFYKTMLGLTSVGDPRTNNTVNAPSQLMSLNLANVRRSIDRQACLAATAGRSLYPNFFSREEEQAIRLRLSASTSKPMFFGSSPEVQEQRSRMGSRRLVGAPNGQLRKAAA